MIEKSYNLSKGDGKIVEKVIQDDNLDYIHMIFNKDEDLPIHYSNSNVYMTVLQGYLTITLDNQDVRIYSAGTLLKIPYKTKMHVRNKNEEKLELLVIKVPSAKNYPKD